MSFLDNLLGPRVEIPRQSASEAKFLQAVAQGDGGYAAPRQETHVVSANNIIQKDITDTSASYNTPQRVEISGDSLYISKNGTTPGVQISLRFDNGLQLLDVVPGTTIETKFESFTFQSFFSTNETGIGRNSLRFFACKNGSKFFEDQTVPMNGTPRGSGSFTNISTGIASGFQIPPSSFYRMRGSTGKLRVKFYSGSAQTFTAGSCRLWFHDDYRTAVMPVEDITGTSGQWFPLAAVSIPTGNTTALLEFTTNATNGTLFVENFGVTLSAAGPNFNYAVEIF